MVPAARRTVPVYILAFIKTNNPWLQVGLNSWQSPDLCQEVQRLVEALNKHLRSHKLAVFDKTVNNHESKVISLLLKPGTRITTG